MYSSFMFWKNRRHIVTALIFFGLFNVYALRANLSIAIVAMTENRNRTLENGAIIEEGPEFDWDSQLQGYVLSSFFYGYITTQILGGWISAKIGGKRVFGIGIAATAVLTLLTPCAVNLSVYLLLTIRVMEGIFEGVTYPCVHAIWSRWAPPLERTKLATIAFSGGYVGTVVSMTASAYLATAFGWPVIFYVFGGIGIVWYVIWEMFVAESPADDKRISKEELEYIKQSLGNVDGKRNIKHPWKEILTSPPVWAIVFSHFTDNWGFYTLLTELPTFMKDTSTDDLAQAGYLSSLPYIGMVIMIQFSGWLADWLRRKEILTTTQVRKIFNCTAFVVHAGFMLGVAFSTSLGGTITCLILAVGLGVFSWSGFGVNHLDIAPQHASIIMGLSNTFATLAGIISPILTGHIVTTHTREEWKIVFCIASGIFVLGSVVYGFFASGEVQDWAVEADFEKKDAAVQKIDWHHDNLQFGQSEVL